MRLSATAEKTCSRWVFWSGEHQRRARGRVGGRRPRLTEDQAALAQRLYDQREKTVQQIADMFGVPRSTVYGHLDKTKIVPRQPKSTVTKPR